VSAPIPGVGAQHVRAGAGTDPRGALVFEGPLPDQLQRDEDSTQNADRERGRLGPFFGAESLQQRSAGVYALNNNGAWVPDTVELRDAAEDAGLTRIGWIGWRSFFRDATDAEYQLLEHLGYEDLPALLYTTVSYRSPGVRHRSWPQLPDTPAEV